MERPSCRYRTAWHGIQASVHKLPDGQGRAGRHCRNRCREKSATIEDAYGQTRQQLTESIDEFEENRSALQVELDALTDAERVKEVRGFYKAAVKACADLLGIAREEVASVKIGARPAMGAGSSGPRVYLAMHMAMLETNAKYGSGPRFPFIIDTPRQQVLDDPNTGRLLSAVFNHAQAEQIFIANESVPVECGHRRRIALFKPSRKSVISYVRGSTVLASNS